MPDLQDEVASAMVALLADPDGTIRASALNALAVWGRPGDDRAMAPLLDDKVTFVQANARKALANETEDPEIIARIVGLTGKPGIPSREIEEIVQALGPRAEPALLDLLASDTPRGANLRLTHAGESRD